MEKTELDYGKRDIQMYNIFPKNKLFKQNCRGNFKEIVFTLRAKSENDGIFA